MATTPQLLPAGNFTTSGNQVIDQFGNPVRIACIGWTGSNGRNSVPEGLDQANYQTLLSQVASIGFNCIRLTYCDASVVNNDFPQAGTINFTLNPTMSGLSVLGVHDLIITYCGTIGLRVIIDSHTNEGFNSISFGAYQLNGLWYDLGGATDNTDGQNAGTFTDTAFVNMWKALATRYKTFSAILGYDIRNEPHAGLCTWGDGNFNTDIRGMYQRVGNAILAIDPRPLIICEGPQNYNGTFASGLQSDGINYGTGNNFFGNSGDCSGVRLFPVVLTTPGKVVYSAHEYPPETSGNALDRGGQAKVDNMTAIWGFLVKNNIAPVFIGEMGSFFNGSAAQVSESTTWMNMMVSYMNGTAANGPRFTGAQQGIMMDWWVLAVDESGNNSVPAFGILTAWQNGVARTNQFNLYKPLFYYGNPAPGGSGSTSPNGTQVPPAVSIVDANANVWTITSGGQVAVNGVTDATTSSIILLAYISGLIWRESAALLWAHKATPTDVWIAGPNPLGAGPVPSPNGTVVTSFGPAITDANGNLWALNSFAQVTINGVADTVLANVVELAFVGNQIWALNGAGRWFFRTLPQDAWLPVGGTTVSPLTPGTPRVVAPLTGSVTTGSWVAHDISVSGVTLRSNKQVHFCTLLPAQYSTSQIYPVVIWLHPTFATNWYTTGGQPGGEGATDLCFADADGFYNTVTIRRAYPFIAVVGYADQTSGNDSVDNWGGWVNNGTTGSGTNASGDTGPNVFGLQGVLNWVLTNMSADPTRVYIEGFSLGGIGAEYNLLKYNQVNGNPPLYTAGMSTGGVQEIHGFGSGPSTADVATMKNVPVWWVSGGQDGTSRPQDWNDPMWVAQAGNTNYPAPGGTAAQAQAGTSQYRYWRDPNIGHQQTDQFGNPYPTNTTILNFLFAQSGSGTVVVPPPPTIGPIGPANATWQIINGILAWTPNQPVLRGARAANNGVAYECVVPGTTAATTGPIGTSGNILDGSARWKWLATIDFLDRSGAVAALPTSFSGNLVWQFWNVASQTTQAATSFFTLAGHAMPSVSLTMTAAPGEGIRSALTNQTLPLNSNSTAGVCFLQPLAAVAAAINYTIIADPTVLIDGLQFIDPCSTSGSTIFQAASTNTQLTVRNCIFDGYTQPGGANMLEIDTAGGVVFTNCLFIDRSSAAGVDGTVRLSAASSVSFINCTFISINNATGASPIDNNSALCIIRNCAFFGYGAIGYINCSIGSTITSSANFGSGTLVSLNIFNALAVNQFINPTTDFRLLPTSQMIDAAASAYGAGNILPAGDDIAGTPRKQGPQWDMGCWERISFSVASVRPPPVKFW